MNQEEIENLNILITAQEIKLIIINTHSPGGDLQDGRGVRHGDHLPSHNYIRNTSTCGQPL